MKIKKVYKRIIAFTLSLVTLFFALSLNVASVNAFAEVVPGTSMPAILIGSLYDTLCEMCMYLGNNISERVDISDEDIKNVFNGIGKSALEAIGIDSDTFLSLTECLILLSYAGASEEDKQTFSQAYPDGISLDDVCAQGSSGAQVSTKLWSDIKRDYYETAKGTSAYTSSFSVTNTSLKEVLSHYRVTPINMTNKVVYQVISDFSFTYTDGSQTDHIKALCPFSNGSYVGSVDNYSYGLCFYSNYVNQYHVPYLYYMEHTRGEEVWKTLRWGYASISVTEDGSSIKSITFNSSTPYFEVASLSSNGSSVFRSTYSNPDMRKTSNISFDGYIFDSDYDAVDFFNQLLLNNYNESLVSSVGEAVAQPLTYRDVIDNDTLTQILNGRDYVTKEELQKILAVDYSKYTNTSDYITDARQYITINEGDTHIEEGDTHITYTSTYDDANLLEKLKIWFEALILNITEIVATIGSWNFKDWFEELTMPIKAIAGAIDDWAEEREEWTFADWWNVFCGYLQDWTFADWFGNIIDLLNLWDFADWWPELLERLGTWTFADWFEEIIELLKSILKNTWLEDVLEAIESIALPIAEPLDITKALTDFFVIDTAAIEDAMAISVDVPAGFNDFMLIPANFKSRYSQINYPVFKINTPDIIRPYYSCDVIVLYDTSDHAWLFSKVRMIMTFALYFGICMWVIKFFKGQFIGGKGGND